MACDGTWTGCEAGGSHLPRALGRATVRAPLNAFSEMLGVGRAAPSFSRVVAAWAHGGFARAFGDSAVGGVDPRRAASPTPEAPRRSRLTVRGGRASGVAGETGEESATTVAGKEKQTRPRIPRRGIPGKRGGGHAQLLDRLRTPSRARIDGRVRDLPRRSKALRTEQNDAGVFHGALQGGTQCPSRSSRRGGRGPLLLGIRFSGQDR